jgi:hypothetical protein
MEGEELQDEKCWRKEEKKEADRREEVPSEGQPISCGGGRVTNDHHQTRG